MTSRPAPNLKTVLLQNAAMAAAYVVASVIGRRFGWVDSYPGPVWPPSGVTIAAVLLFGRRLLPGVAIGSVAAGAIRGAPFLLSLGFMAANVVEPLICAVLLAGVRFRSDLGRLRSLVFYVCAVVVAASAAASIGAGCLAGWLGTPERFWPMWRVWFTGNAMGAILLGTALLTWHQGERRRRSWPRFLEGAALFASLYFVCRLAFPPLALSGVTSLASLLLFPLQIWAAARFGPRGSTAAALVAGIIGIWDMSQLLLGQPQPIVRERLLLLQAFIACFSLAGLALASVIEERRRAEEESRLFLSAIGASQDGVIIGETCASAGSTFPRVLYANEAGERLLGHPVGRLTSRPTTAIFGPGLLPAVEGKDAEVFAGGTAVSGEARLGLGEQARDIDWQLSPVADGKEVRHFVAVVRDVTRKRRSEVDLAMSHERFRALVSGLPDTLIRFSSAGVVMDAIAPQGGLFASEIAALVGKPLPSALPAELSAQLLEAASAALAGAGPQVAELRLGAGPEGRHVEARVVKSGPDEALATLHDITEHRQMQSRLLLSDRMASVGTLAAGVAHEINNPLSFVIANQTLLQEHCAALAKLHPSPLIQECLELLRESAEGTERVRRIVRDLKIFSRGHDDEAAGPTDLRHALDRSIALAWNEIRHKAKLVKQYGDVPRVSANEARLGQVFLNLIVNAAQAIPDGNVEGNEIRITTRVEAGRAAIEIRDTGAGIPKANLQRIFDPFFTTKPVGVGTGLGLAICHQIVTAHGGELEVESEVGKGTLFRIRLPLAGQVDRKKSTPPPLRAAEVHERRSVLVVDDEVLLARSLKRLLAPEHDVEVASGGREALALLDNGRHFDVILCDLMMPELSGMDLHAELSRTSPDLAGRMVFLTGGAFTPSAREFLERVPNPRVEKPFKLDELKKLVRTAASSSGRDLPHV